MDNTLEKWQNQWNSEGVRILVLASLSIQISLMFLAPFRKCSTNKVLALTIWLLYLTAELVPTLALGNMGKQIDPADSGTIPGDLTILWAPFLLLHLGGPDNITSYSIDDNELWWRLLLGLVVQVIAAAYAFWQSPPNPVLWIPTTLLCIAGMIKFVERTLALRSGSRGDLKNKIISAIDPRRVLIKDEIRPVSTMKRKKEIEDNRGQSHEREIEQQGGVAANENEDTLSESERESQAICEGYVWFNIFKRLLVDVTFSSNLLMQSQDRFSDMNATDALNMVAIELSFLYDILHTKAVHMHYNFNRVLRFSTMVSIIAALIVFHLLDKQKYASKDILITYILFGAGLTLEVVAALLLVSSDWTFVSLRKKDWRKSIACAIIKMVRRFTLMKGKSRWSKTIGQFNLVSLCLRDRDTLSAKFMRIIKIKRIWDNMRESKFIPLPEILEDYMFIQAKKRAPKIHIYNELVEARSYRGKKALKDQGQLETLEWSMNRDFDECIILWHIATDICYYEDTSGQPKEDESECVVSLMISNYMVYLLTQQQSMMQVRYGQLRFEGTCGVVKKKFTGVEKLDPRKARDVLTKNEGAAKNEGATPVPEQNGVLKKIGAKLRRRGRHKRKEDKHKCEDVNIWGESVLSNSHRLAKELQKVDQQIRWKLISETWMEMLGYAAIHCDPYQHAKSLSRGGELLTHLWLLMAQLGVVEEQKMQQFDLEIV